MKNKRFVSFVIKLILFTLVGSFFAWSFKSGYYQLIMDDAEGFIFLLKQRYQHGAPVLTAGNTACDSDGNTGYET